MLAFETIVDKRVEVSAPKEIVVTVTLATAYRMPTNMRRGVRRQRGIVGPAAAGGEQTTGQAGDDGVVAHRHGPHLHLLHV